MSGDSFIPTLQSLGYTQRDAGFLYLVAVHTGYFFRRQFDYFIDRNKGAIVANFLAKARAAGHIEVIEYSGGWRVYHLLFRAIYRVANLPESRDRQRKGDAICSSLITLDNVLENHNTEYFLATAEEKINFFRRHRHCPPSFYKGVDDKFSSVLKSSAISQDDRYHPLTSLVRTLFVEGDLLSPTKFRRVLVELEPLLCHLGNFELIYGSNSEHNLSRLVRSSTAGSRVNVRNPDRVIDDLHARRLNPGPNRVLLAREFVTILFKYARSAAASEGSSWSAHESGVESEKESSTNCKQSASEKTQPNTG